LRELILLEEFTNSVSKQVFVYLQEKNVSKVEDAAVLANTYALLHRGSLERHSKYVRGKGNDKRNKKHVIATGVTPNPQGKVRQGDDDAAKASLRPKVCFYCGKSGH